MKHAITGLVALAMAGAAMAVTPGKVLKMVPQSGTSKSFDLITENGITVRVQFYTPQVFRILAAPQKLEPQLDRHGNPVKDADGNVKTYVSADFSDPKNDPEKAQILVGVPEDATRVVFADNREAGTYTFSTTALTLTVDKADCRFTLIDRLTGKTVWAETKPLDLDAEKGTTQTLATTADECFYGGGQQNGEFAHKGRKISILADGNWNEGGHPNPSPFYQTNTGYGVLRHTFATGEYDFSGEKEIRTTHAENRFDAFYFVGGDFAGNLNLYTQFTGRPNFIPRWGLQLGDADAYITRDKETREPAQNEDGSYKEVTPVDAVRVAKAYREHDMPCGWLLVNDGYGCDHMQLGYVADTLAGLGFHTGLWTEGALDRINWEVGHAGSRVQKIDVAWSGPAYQHALECNKIAAEGIERNADARAFVWTVQGWAGTQRYGICWTGDQSGSWDLIRYHIPTLTGSSMSGQAYATTDVDGIFGGSNETYLRDLQWKCWTTAIYAMNGWSNMNKSPWSYPEPYRSLNRAALLHKNRIVPFVYSYMAQAWAAGEPIVRPLVYNFPEDRHTWGDAAKYQFMLGEEVLVAPVYSSMKLNRGWRKDIYLPEGTWYDYNDGRRIVGPTTLAAYPITLATQPVFVRAGSIIPMYPEMLVLGDKPFDPITFDVYPDFSGGRDAFFRLYEDDGETQAFRKYDAYTTQDVCVRTFDRDAYGLILVGLDAVVGNGYEGMPEARSYEFLIHCPVAPESVFLTNPDGSVGQEILKLDGERAATAYANARQAWFYDPAEKNGLLRVKLARTPLSETRAFIVHTKPFSAIQPTKPYPVPEVTNELDRSEFAVSVNSQAGDALISAAFDGTEETMWHSYWRDDKAQPTDFPYVIDVDMNGLYPVNTVTYLPRANLGNGVIKGYKVEAARFPGRFKTVAEGEFEKFTKVEPRAIAFDATWARYLRITFTSAQNGSHFGSAAEIDVLQDLDAEPLPDETQDIGSESIEVDGVEYGACRKDTVGADWTLDLDGTWDKIKGHAGMESGNANTGTVTFRILADGKQIFSRDGMKPEDVKQLIDVDIPAGTKQLRFTLTAEAGASASDTGVWTELRLFRAGSGTR